MNGKSPQGPRGHFLVGNSPEFLKDSLSFIEQIAHDYGDVVKFNIGPFTTYLLNHPDYIHQVLVTDAKKFQKSFMFKLILSKYIGNSVVNSDGDFWKKQRKLMQPAFHHNRIQSYAQTMVDYTVQLMENWRDEVDIDVEMMNVTLRIASKTLFDTDIAESGDVQEAMNLFQEMVGKAVKSPPILPDWIPTQDNRNRKRINQMLDDVVLKIIGERRQQGNEDRGDLLSMLMQATYDDGSHMGDKQLRDEVLTLFLAGHETTAIALSWAIYLLATHPEAEQKLMDELDIVLAGRLPEMRDLPRLTYTDMVIQEAMRLYPPAWQTQREALEDVEIGGYTIKKGSTVMVSPYLAHRDARWWENPDKFIPERFTPENMKDQHKYAYFPFGGGPRICIGNQFAMMEAVLVLATIMQRCEFSLVPGQDIQPAPLATLRSTNGIKMWVRKPEMILA
jgi:cytochrome P450